MALQDGLQKITRDRQMDGTSNKEEELCKIANVKEWVDRVLEEKNINK